MTAHPRLAAVVGVCDENEVIGKCIAHLEAQGVQSIVVVDMNSVDGTREQLVEMRDAGRIVLIERNNDPSRDLDYLTSGVEHARRVFAPDWILVQDADEFWISASGDLGDALAGAGCAESVFLVDRYNACLCDDLLSKFATPISIGDIASLGVWAEPLRLTRALMDENRSIRWISAQPVAMAVARANVIGGVAAGGHAIVGFDGAIMPAERAADLLIVHVPFLSFDRFRRKIQGAKALMSKDTTYFTGSIGWHWRRWVDLLDDGLLEQEYRTQMLQASAVNDLRRSGAIRPAHDLLRVAVLSDV